MTVERSGGADRLPGTIDGSKDRLGRRQAVGRAAAIVGGTVAALITRPRGLLGASVQPAAAPFVDMHVHLNDVDMQLALMEEYRLARAAVFWGGRSDNASLLRAATAHPARFIPFASVSPERPAYRALWERNPERLVAELDLLLRTGQFRGIGEISVVHFPSDGFPEADYDPLGAPMRGIMELAARYTLPINVHCEITRLREFSGLVAAFPTVTVIWAHGGYTPYFLARRMLEMHANIVYELSARTWESHPRSPDYTIFRNEVDVWPEWLELIRAYPNRFLVGSDASHRALDSDRRKIESVQRLLVQLPGGVRAEVAEQTPARLLSL